MAVEVGEPVWTQGGFRRVAAQDDLGLESVGAGLLRRLLPGIVQTTPNAGYYSYYPYLLARWEDSNSSVRRTDFKPWFRRQEAAYATACTLHDHRGGVYLNGINGRNGAGRVLAALGPGDSVPVGRMAEPDGYMESAYGGYGLFYGRVLSDMRLTQIGASGLVDRATELGREVSDMFGEAFEATEYYRRWFTEPEVPFEVLAELGEAACLCSIPGRPDHAGLLDVFIHRRHDESEWEDRRITRIESLGLFMSFHAHRPVGDPSGLGAFRRALLTGHFPGGELWKTSSAERWNSWRAYQLRESAVLALGSVWTAFLLELDRVGPMAQGEIRDRLVRLTRWSTAGLEPSMTVGAAVEALESVIPDGGDLIAVAEQLEDVRALEREDSLALAISVLLRVRSLTQKSAAGFDELVGEGGSWRWSLAHLAEWIDHRQASALEVLLAELVDALLNQHRRVGLGKVRVLDERDPFCVAEDNGILTMIRSDEPFWTAARYRVVNHLLWTLGLLTSPEEDPRLTSLGLKTLAETANANA